MRYLTRREKEKTLGYLRDTYKKASLDPDGHLDLEMIPYLERINACDGMVTLQSCTGHKKSKKYPSMSGGHLWVRLSKEMTVLLDGRLWQLVRCKFVTQIDKIYHFYEFVEVREVIDISFPGHEDDSFYQTMEFITQFFERLCKSKKKEKK